MELTQLEYFLEVAKCNSISLAAEKLHITPPALSKAISRLEGELDCSLFDRGVRRISLNEKGKLFKIYVGKAFEMLDAGVRLVSPKTDILSSKTTICILNRLMSYVSRPLRDACQYKFPLVTFKFISGPDNAFHRVEGQEPFDIELTATPTDNETEIFGAYTEKWCMIYNRNYKKQFGKSVSARQMAQEPIVFYGTDESEAFLRAKLSEAGEEANIIRADNGNTSSVLISRCAAVAAVPVDVYEKFCTLQQVEENSLKAAFLSDIRFEREVYLQCRNGFPATQEDCEVLEYINGFVKKYMDMLNDFADGLMLAE